MITIKENKVDLVVTGDPKELDALVQNFRFRPNGFIYSPRYAEYVATEGKHGWDGYLSPVRRISRTAAVSLRGRRDDILTFCESAGYAVNTTQLLPKLFEQISVADIPPDIIKADFELDTGQRKAIVAWLYSAVGVNQVTVAGGKTAMLAGAAAMIKQRLPDARFVYITPSERLVRQSYAEMRKFLPGWGITQFGGGKSDNTGKDMVVCTIAILNRHFERLAEEGWLGTFVCILGDECHHFSSPSAKRVLQAIPAYFRLGASDSTKKHDPARYNDITGLLGPILTQVKPDKLIAAGRLAKPHVYAVEVPGWKNRHRGVPYTPEPGTEAVMQADGWKIGTYLGPVHERDEEGKVITATKRNFNAETAEWEEFEAPVVSPGLHRIALSDKEVVEVESRYCLLERAYDCAIIRFRERNEKIVEWVKHFSSLGYPTLVVCTRTLHVFILEALIKRAIGEDKTAILFGDSTSTERDRVFAWLKDDGSGKVLITPLVKEGVSINELRAGVVADYVGEFEVANQILGRFLRKKETNNWAEVVWFVDNQHPTFHSSSRNVISKLEEVAGYQVYWGVNSPSQLQ